MTNDIYISRDKPMIVFKKRVENLMYNLNYETVVLYATGAAINTAVKLYLDWTKFMGVKNDNQIITYSVPATYTKQSLKQAAKSPIEHGEKGKV